ncbi:MAG: D-alanyl-D-alanine dipeptidase [Clostridia bacterium]|nr:D-alanyl-D-alanine dipeptidase [Clostridia bacterium]
MDEVRYLMGPIPPYPVGGWERIPAIKECGEPLVDITDLDPRICYGAAYLSQGMDGALDRCWVREGVWKRLERAAELLPQRFSFMIFDGLRPLRVQKAIYDQFKAVIEQERPDFGPAQVEMMLDDFVAKPIKRLERPAPHTTGGAVDLTLCLDGKPLDMGTGFDALVNMAHTDWYEKYCKAGDESIRDQRRLLYHVMEAAGFASYDCEWWHYSYGDRAWAREKNRTPIYGFCKECDFS